MTDPVSDLLSRIKNCYLGRKKSLSLPYSRFKMSICELLKSNGYISDAKKINKKNVSEIIIKLKYREGLPPFEKIQMYSTPGRKVYFRISQLKKIQKRSGLSIISTSKGLLSAQEASKQGHGGQAICRIY